MICKACDTNYPAHYKECPSCKSKEAKKPQYARKPHKEQDEIKVPTDPFVVDGEIASGEFRVF